MSKRKKAILDRINIFHSTYKEDLPLPYVHYPEHYGTYIGYSEERESQIYLCSCSARSIENYLLINNKENELGLNDNQFTIHKLKLKDKKIGDKITNNWKFNSDFPFFNLKEGVEYKLSSLIKFKDGICHKCNNATPSVTYCHPMYGSKFKQSYGWYINQHEYHIGIKGSFIVEDYCPKEFIINKRKSHIISNLETKERLFRFNLLNSDFTEIDVTIEERKYIDSIILNEQSSDKEKVLRKELSRLERSIINTITNEVRTEFGFRKIGEGWISESIMHQIICKIFPNDVIHFHFRPDWLQKLEIDVFNETKKIAFEYQGQQHYKPIKLWGGEKALKKQKERDKLKKQLLKKLNIRLIEVRYDEPLTDHFLREKIEKVI
ncbi:hypothetical protein [Flammeovirga sp. EKP202]|uniref:hypothetical protein n=1 Tax=Flammeovirga sp. EKP202 TaxID=2770592 RepID=UPI00165FE153|nr:hypothetical protein [Flammeovirga sp. EKP202]MBD0403536.1 hypothetical protein [Flammeovirga sp. EKP202]